jgi:hypothetical protein
VGVLAVDLGLLGFPYNPRVSATSGLGPPPPGSLAFLVQEEARHAEPFRVVADGYLLTPNLASLYGLWDPRAYDVMRPVALARTVTELLKDDRGNASLAIRYRLTSPRRRLAPPWSLAFSGPGGRVWRNDTALPLFFFPRSVEANGAGDTAAATDADLAERVLVAGAPPPPAGHARSGQQGVVAVSAASGNRLELAVTSPTGGVVASSVSWDPGWRLALDGAPARILVVNGAFLGFEVPTGRHTAVFDYSPRPWRAGLALASAAGVATLAVALWRRRKRPAQL